MDEDDRLLRRLRRGEKRLDRIIERLRGLLSADRVDGAAGVRELSRARLLSVRAVDGGEAAAHVPLDDRRRLRSAFADRVDGCGRIEGSDRYQRRSDLPRGLELLNHWLLFSFSPSIGARSRISRTRGRTATAEITAGRAASYRRRRRR